MTATVRNHRDALLSGVMPDDWPGRWTQYQANQKAKGKARKGKR